MYKAEERRKSYYSFYTLNLANLIKNPVSLEQEQRLSIFMQEDVQTLKNLCDNVESFYQCYQKIGSRLGVRGREKLREIIDLTRQLICFVPTSMMGNEGELKISGTGIERHVRKIAQTNKHILKYLKKLNSKNSYYAHAQSTYDLLSKLQELVGIILRHQNIMAPMLAGFKTVIASFDDATIPHEPKIPDEEIYESNIPVLDALCLLQDNSRSMLKKMILRKACQLGRYQIVEHIIQQGGIDINKPLLGLTNPGFYLGSPLLLASDCPYSDDQMKTVQVLLKNGADVHKSSLNLDAVGAAVQYANIPLVTLFLDHKASLEKVRQDHGSLIVLMLEKTKNLCESNQNNQESERLLAQAITFIEFLVEHHKEKIDAKNPEKLTPLLFAVSHFPKPKLIEKILECKADVTQTVDIDGDGVQKNALAIAQSDARYAIVQLLKEHNAI